MFIIRTFGGITQNSKVMADWFFEWMYDRRSELYIDVMCVLLIAVYAVPSDSVWEKVILTSVVVPFVLFVARGLKLRRFRRRNPLPDDVDFRVFIKKKEL